MIKAYRNRRLTLHDICIISGKDSRFRGSVAPEVRVVSEEGSWEDAQIVPVNISHDSGYATAVCLAQDLVSNTRDLQKEVARLHFQLRELKAQQAGQSGDQHDQEPFENNGLIRGITTKRHLVRTIAAEEKPLVRKVGNVVGNNNVDAFGEYEVPLEGEEWEKAHAAVVRTLLELKNNPQYMDRRAFIEQQLERAKERKLKGEAEGRQQLSERIRDLEDELAEMKRKELVVEGSEAEPDQALARELIGAFAYENLPLPEDEDLAPGDVKEKGDKSRRTIFIGGLSPKTTTEDLEATFANLSEYVKAYLYKNEDGHLLGTGAVVLATEQDAKFACKLRDRTLLDSRKIRCMPFFKASYRRFLQSVVERDAMTLSPEWKRKQMITESLVPEENGPALPIPLLEPEPLPRATSPQYILVREMFRIQEEEYKRRKRGIYVSGINEDATAEDVLGLFGDYGNVRVDLTKKRNGESSGNGFVTFEKEEVAEKARLEMDGVLFLGQQITCAEIGARQGLRREPQMRNLNYL